MREIKFRGLDVLTGEWCYGSLLKANNEGGLAIWRFNEMNIPLVTMIDRDTAGQYTGLKDKNSVEIYDGDIMQNLRNKKIKISWSEDEMGWVAKSKYPNGRDSTLMLADYSAVATIEVIGNIHENPELLEVST